MSETTTRPVRRHLRWPARLVVFLLVAALVFGGTVLALGLSGQAVSAPRWVVSAIEDRANTGLAGRASVRIGAVEAVVQAGFVPRLRVVDVELFSPRGRRLATLDSMGASFWPRPLLNGIVQPRNLRLTGARVALRRTAAGDFDIALPDTGVAAGGALSPAQILDEVDRAFGLPALRAIERVEVKDLSIRFEDDRAGQSWTIADGRMSLTQYAARLAYDVNFSVAGPAGEPAQVEVSFSTEKSNSEAGIIARVTGVSAQDLAAQSPALSWLAALEAPISGALRTGIDRNGMVQVMQAELDIGAGAVKPRPDVAPLPFDQARVALSYRPASNRLDFTDIAIKSPSLSATGTARAWLQGMETGFPEALVVQLRMAELAGNPDGMFAALLVFEDSLIDFKLALDPFRVTLGQMTLFDQGKRITAQGTAAAGEDGWNLSLDAEMASLDARRLVELWPVTVADKTRSWLSENLLSGEAFNAHGALRFQAGQAPVFNLGFEFRDAAARFVKTMPPITAAAGFGTLDTTRFSLTLEKGTVLPPAGGEISIAGSSMRVDDIRLKPATGIFDLKTEGSLTAALSLLDQKPLEVMRKAERGVDLAEGDAEVELHMVLPLRKGLKIADVDYEARAQLANVRSDRIVEGKQLLAPRLSVIADKDGVSVSGAGTLSGARFDATWRQSAAPEEKGRSTVAGTVELSPGFLTAFGLSLPEEVFTGRGSGEIALDLTKGEPTRYHLTSGLGGITMAIPALGWSKAPGTQGRLDVAGVLGHPTTVESLELEAGGLSVLGDVTMAADGGLEAARFPRVTLGGWFEGAVELLGRGKGLSAAIVITGGTADLTRGQLGGAGGGGNSGPISVALDRLQVTEGIGLNRFRGDFTVNEGLQGRFTGLVNGAAPVNGAVVPVDGRTAYRVQSDDAGAVLSAAGIFGKARGGTLDLALRPEGEKGRYAGTVEMSSIRVVDTPVLAGLLDAVSVVGLIDQLRGPGILFNKASGAFRMTPEAVEISEGAATGASMGISVAGVYHADRKEMDLQGTISPIYLLNGIGRIVSKKGEGLFGFNYTMKGPTSAPRIRVNPLSLLTPGMFREIFRSAPPTIDE